jgi:hypothetical protein
MDRWAWEQIDPWLRLCVSPRVGALPCVVQAPTQRRHGRPRLFAKRFASSRSEPASVVASRRISFGTRTLSRWLEKACHST